MKPFLNISIWIFVIGCLCRCTDQQQECLAYQGKIQSYACERFVIKVTNRSVNSFMESGAGRVENVIAARIPIGSAFYEYFGEPIEEQN